MSLAMSMTFQKARDCVSRSWHTAITSKPCFSLLQQPGIHVITLDPYLPQNS